MAELSYEATLEDLGFVRAKQVLLSDSSQVGTAARFWYRSIREPLSDFYNPESTCSDPICFLCSI